MITFYSEYTVCVNLMILSKMAGLNRSTKTVLDRAPVLFIHKNGDFGAISLTE